jgi:hypothetical protein
MSRRVCLLVIDDGREDYLARCLASVSEQFPFFNRTVHIDDTQHALGFAGAVQEGWRQVLDTGCDYVVHVESDFLFNERVPLMDMIAVLEANPYLTQMTLLRQAWNDVEKAAGGIVQACPEQFEEITRDGHTWTETRRWIFSTNPSVYPVELCRRGFPDPPESEGRFGGMLYRDRPECKSAFWGGKFDPPKVTHIGGVRTGGGY